ncbi:ArsR/SmtB family transcription factor [Roseateles sp.]|uniref:ArsR/SmtB family transcription factor n=1 Tax=Roseateles sp. TaxID=1971397 RepID=UPI003BA9ED5E
MSAAEPRLARVAAAIADATWASTLARLLDGRLYTAGELARHAGVTAATMSGHLKLLVDEGLARVRPQGRHRYFGLADGDVAHALEALLRVTDVVGGDDRAWLGEPDAGVTGAEVDAGGASGAGRTGARAGVD